jgi:hypothetical protein
MTLKSQTQKWKGAFARKLPAFRTSLFKSILTFSILVFQQACALKRDSQDQPECKGRGEIQISGRDQDFRSDFELKYMAQGNTLFMNLLSPIGTRSARLELSDDVALWKDSQGTKALGELPLFEEWLSGPWEDDLQFVFLKTDKQSASSQLRVSCQGEFMKRQCQISHTKGEIRIAFDFLECASALRMK